MKFFAAARAAAGADELQMEFSSLAELNALCATRSPDLGALMESCTFLVDGIAEINFTKSLAGAVQVDVLPKFAGG